jgi:hypothetical protein
MRSKSTIILSTIFLFFGASICKAGVYSLPSPVKVPSTEESQDDSEIIEYEREADDDSFVGEEETSSDGEVVNGGDTLESSQDWQDYLVYVKKKKGKKRGECKCSSGCGMNQKGLKSEIKKLVAAAGKKKIYPASCIRTQACQDRLRRCYEKKCGMRGRAAKKSKHADGRACDFSKRNGGELTKIKRKNGLKIKRLTHGKEGGGLHEYQ